MTVIQDTKPETPPSFNDFMSAHKIDSIAEGVEKYSQIIQDNIGKLAAYYGVDRDDLHAMKFVRA